MPETSFRIRWPDGVEEDCYSPSTVIHDHLKAGQTYRVDDFDLRSRTALDLAARRVEAKYGFRCSSADAQAAKLAIAIARYKPEETIRCLTIR
ncbi:MSMEG_0570 family nitrogen starvation response protein [Sulfitobacter sabulilitoris]|uniref:MSMEG_0570 family nitrogen starvation response protein n=1 Tax=Sulfitobacter sabulilitoris TaxID=2562655 RepID=A0A5S3P7L9_9RHOB|nr:MSMEG_0570 family nitrogen starvation response protein [Sulfitobacter sabulilitoris]TMM49198.1 MSMEG_0570 family nitrogen starvation response protein [Sulfitobacter sabulilitoris]